LTELLVYLVAILIFGGLCFHLGRRSRKYPLTNEDQAHALRYFLYKEVYRHRLDVRRAKKDIRTLEREWGIVGPAPGGLDAWIDAKRRKL
jgi:hypothetical protein